jgi:hypothetical protein
MQYIRYKPGMYHGHTDQLSSALLSCNADSMCILCVNVICVYCFAKPIRALEKGGRLQQDQWPHRLGALPHAQEQGRFSTVQSKYMLQFIKFSIKIHTYFPPQDNSFFLLPSKTYSESPWAEVAIEAQDNRYRKLLRFTTKVLHIQLSYWTWNPHGLVLVQTLQSRNVLQQSWHGTEATDSVTGAVQQQFSTDLNSYLFACQLTSWAGPAKW